MLIPQNDSMPYGRMPDWLMSIPSSILSDGAKLCYMKLYQYYNIYGSSFPKAETLAEKLHVTRRQIVRDIAKLKKLKLIRVKRRAGTSSDYDFLDNKWRRSSLPVDKYGYNCAILWLAMGHLCLFGWDIDVSLGETFMSHIVKVLIKKNNNSTPGGVRVVDNFSFSLGNCPTAFKKCMNIYPRTLHRTRTKTTFTLWKAAVTKHGEEKVYEGTASFARYCAAIKKEPRLVYGRKAFYGKEEHYLTDWADVFEKTKGYNPKSHFTFSSRADDYHKATKEVSKAQQEKNKKSARKLKNKANGGEEK